MPIDQARIDAIRALVRASRESTDDRKACDSLAAKAKYRREAPKSLARARLTREHNWDYIQRLAGVGNPQAKAIYEAWLESCGVI